MLKLIASRLVAAIPIVLGLTLLIFLMIQFSPIDPVTVILGDTATESAKAAMREELGLDRPWPLQFLTWLGGAVQLDFGRSIYTNLPVTQMITDRLPVTVSLVALSGLVAVVFGLAVGIVSARFRKKAVDRVLMTATSIGLAIPSFWLGILLALVFGVALRWLPVIGYTSLLGDPLGWGLGLVMPVVAMSIYPAGVIARQTRGAMIDALDSSYSTALRARGLPTAVLVNRYAFRNALPPVLAVIGIQLSHLIGASFVIEKVFGMSGLGSLLIDSVTKNDFAVLQAVTLIVVLGVLLVNILLDVVHAYVDPKARLV